MVGRIHTLGYGSLVCLLWCPSKQVSYYCDCKEKCNVLCVCWDLDVQLG